MHNFDGKRSCGRTPRFAQPPNTQVFGKVKKNGGEVSPQKPCCNLKPDASFRRSFLRRLRSPGSQRWQNSQSKPLAHPSWKTKAQGLHAPHGWSAEPRLGIASVPNLDSTASDRDASPTAATVGRHSATPGMRPEPAAEEQLEWMRPMMSAEPCSDEGAAVEHTELPASRCRPRALLGTRLAPRLSSLVSRAAAAAAVVPGEAFESGSGSKINDERSKTGGDPSCGALCGWGSEPGSAAVGGEGVGFDDWSGPPGDGNGPRGVTMQLPVGVAIAKGSSMFRAQGLREPWLPCRDRGRLAHRLTGLERHRRSSTKRSREGSLAGL